MYSGRLSRVTLTKRWQLHQLLRLRSTPATSNHLRDRNGTYRWGLFCEASPFSLIFTLNDFGLLQTKDHYCERSW